MRDLELALYILASMGVVAIIALIVLSPFIYQIVEERKYRKWEKSQKK